MARNISEYTPEQVSAPGETLQEVLEERDIEEPLS